MNYSDVNRSYSDSVKMGTILRGISEKDGEQNPFVYVSREGDNVHTLHQIDGHMDSCIYKHDDLTNPTLYEIVGNVDLMSVIKTGLNSVMDSMEKRMVKRLVRLVLLKDCEEGRAGRTFMLYVYTLDNQATESEVSEYISTMYLFDMTQWSIEEIRTI